MITFDDFDKIEMKIGKVLSAEKVEGTDKLLKMEIDFGSEKREIVAGIAEYIQPTHLLGKGLPFVVNLEPRTIRGIESRGMILAVDINDKPVLLCPEEDVPPGSIVR
jgi:methionine--tRNA ligase beta chain